MSRPIVVIPCCTRHIDGYSYDTVRHQYTAAVAEVAECQPLLIPVGPRMSDLGAILAVADGILLSGSPSNIEPSHYSDEKPALPDFLDPARDALTLPLIREAVGGSKVPLFAICRGFQELNVALGGTLHQEVHEEEGYRDHRGRNDLPLPERWGPAHVVKLDNELRQWVGRDEIMVNSLHGQGIERLAPKLKPQAHAEDGLVEAVMGPAEHPFCLGVQWHPEWEPKGNPVSLELFRRFGAAARSKHA
jgi:putative glutamine amidotransferase